MYDLKGKTIEDVLSDPILKNRIKEEYLMELRGFEKENNQDPYNIGNTCTDVIREVENETELGDTFLTAFTKVVRSLDEGRDDLDDWEINEL